MYITELFNIFQKDRIKEARRCDLDYIKDVYAHTELFDMSNIEENALELDHENFRETLTYVLPLDFFSLPFENCFIRVLYNKDDKVNREMSLFIREYAPNILTGTVTFNYILSEFIIRLNLPFTVHLEEKQSIVTINPFDYNRVIKQINDVFDLGEKRLSKKIVSLFAIRKQCGLEDINRDLEQKAKDDYSKMKTLTIEIIEHSLIEAIIRVQKTFEKLSKHEIIVDKNEKMKPEYYRFNDKRKKTIKVTNRPIYYVLEKNDYENRNYHIRPLGKTEHSHAFKVRGHWRKIDGVGKDRNGNYRIEGFTWVVDYVKGQGELVNRVRIVR